MNAPWLAPIAALEDFIFPAVVILFLLIPALGQVLAKIRQAQQAEDAKRRGPAPGGRVRPQMPPQGDPLREEVGEFLRNAPRSPDRPQSAPQPAPPSPPRSGPPAAPSWGRPVEKPVEVELLEPVRDDRGVRSAIGPGLARTHQMEDHLHEVFDHRLVTLEGASDGPARGDQATQAETAQSPITSMPVTAAAGLAAMLANRTTLRQAIVLNEILQRPEHRW